MKLVLQRYLTYDVYFYCHLKVPSKEARSGMGEYCFPQKYCILRELAPPVFGFSHDGSQLIFHDLSIPPDRQTAIDLSKQKT